MLTQHRTASLPKMSGYRDNYTYEWLTTTKEGREFAKEKIVWPSIREIYPNTNIKKSTSMKKMIEHLIAVAPRDEDWSKLLPKRTRPTQNAVIPTQQQQNHPVILKTKSAYWKQYKTLYNSYANKEHLPVVTYKSSKDSIINAIKTINQGKYVYKVNTENINMTLVIPTVEGVQLVDYVVDDYYSLTEPSNIQQVLNSIRSIALQYIDHNFEVTSWERVEVRFARGIMQQSNTLPNTQGVFVAQRIRLSFNEFQNIPLRNGLPPDFFSLSSGIQINKDECVINALFNHLQGQHGFAKLTLKDLYDKFETRTPCLNEVTAYLTSKDVSYKFRDSMGNLLASYVSECNHTRPLYGVVANEHIYTITNENMIKLEQYTNDKQFKSIRAPYTKEHVIKQYTFEEDETRSTKLYKFITKSRCDFVDRSIPLIIEVINKNTFWCLNDFAMLVLLEENYVCENIVLNGAFINSLTYKDVFVNLRNEIDSEVIIDEMKRIRPLEKIKYTNQSMGELSKLALGRFFKKPSEMNQQVGDAFYNLSPDPQTNVFYNPAEFDESSISCIDIRRCYTACFLKRDEPYYFLSILDQFINITITDSEQITNGYYMIENDTNIMLGPFSFGKQAIVRSMVLKYMLSENAIEYANVKKYLKPTYQMEADVGKSMVKYVYELYLPDKNRKQLINTFNGLLGRYKTQSRQTAIETSFDMSLAMFANGTIDGITKLNQIPRSKIEFELEKDVYLINKMQTNISYKNNRPVYHDNLNDGIIQLYKLYKAMVTPTSTLIYYKTDCICMTNANPVELGEAIGQYRKEKINFGANPSSSFVNLKEVNQANVDEKQWNAEVFETIEVDQFKSKFIDNKLSVRVQGKAGRGKSYTIGKLFTAYEIKHVALGLSNQVRINLKKSGMKAKTLASFFAQSVEESDVRFWTRMTNVVSKLEYIVVDEITMVTKEYLTKLYLLKQKTNIPMIFMGDFRQLPPPDSSGRDNCDLFVTKFMCSFNMIELTKAYRCDEELDKVCDDIYEQKPIDCPFKKVDAVKRVNICYTNKVRRKINDICHKHFMPSTGSDTLGYFDNEPFIAKTNKYNFFNGDRYVYKQYDAETNRVCLIDEENIEHWMNLDVFKSVFELAYCTTIHKTQCLTITEPFNVFEVHKFSNRMAYTAFTRAKTLGQISVYGWPQKNVFKQQPDWQTYNLSNDEDKYVIYALTYELVPFYIGQTDNMARRLDEHTTKSHGDFGCNDKDSKLYSYISTLNKDEIRIKPILYCNEEEKDQYEYMFIQRYIEDGVKLQNTYLVRTLETDVIHESKDKPVVVVMKGTVFDKPNESCIIFKVTKDGKPVYKKVRYGKKITREEAKAKCEEYQRTYSLTGTF